VRRPGSGRTFASTPHFGPPIEPEGRLLNAKRKLVYATHP